MIVLAQRTEQAGEDRHDAREDGSQVCNYAWHSSMLKRLAGYLTIIDGINHNHHPKRPLM